MEQARSLGDCKEHAVHAGHVLVTTPLVLIIR